MSTDVHPALADRWRWMDWSQAAAYLGLTERQLRRAVEGRKISFSRVSREIRFTQDQLDEYVERRTFRPDGAA
jgi:excisionase family DNA binding protein